MFDVEEKKRSDVGPRARFRAFVVLVALGLFFAAAGSQADAGADLAPVDLNRATAEEMTSLPGIGEAKAAAIVAYRKANGAFQSVDDLEAVRGVGPALVTKLRPHVTLGSKPATRGRPTSTK